VETQTTQELRDSSVRSTRHRQGMWMRFAARSPRDDEGFALNKERIADAAAATAWGLFGMSLTQINELLQTVALLLTIVATAITIVIHVRKWLKK
jgi:hypothetical protein